MVRYLPAPRLRQAGLTTNGKSDTYGLSHPFALRYRRVNGTFYELIKFDGILKSRKTPLFVIPANPGSGSGTGAGIQEIQEVLDSRLRGSDDYGDFLRDRQTCLRKFQEIEGWLYSGKGEIMKRRIFLVRLAAMSAGLLALMRGKIACAEPLS